MMNNTTQLRFVFGIVSLALLLFAIPAYAQDDPQPETPNYNPEVVQVDTSNYPEINVYVSVADANGNPVSSLKDDDFTLLENGESVEVTDVFQAGEQGPVTVILTIDRSGSMIDLGKIEAAKQAAFTFVDHMRPEDRTGVVVFNTKVEIIQPITSDKEALRAAINSIQAFGDTAMYDALWESLTLLQGNEGRKAIILLSDGLDNSSPHTFDEVMSLVNQTEASIYTIGLGDPTAGLGSTSAVNEEALQSLASESNGEYFFAPGPDALQDLYQKLSLRLQSEYRITYTTPNTLRNGVERGIQVQIATEDGVRGESGGVQGAYNPGGLIPETAGTLSWSVFGTLAGALLVLLTIPLVFQRIRAEREPAAKPSRVKLKNPTPPGAPPERKSPTARSGVNLRGKKS
jgi:Ca-activated chloride channel family protein